VNRPRTILIRGVNWLGDAVISTAALRRLKEALPDTSITLLCPSKLAPLWQHHPSVQSTISFSPGESVFSVGRKLRAVPFDCALVFPSSFRSAFEIWFSRVPVRIGFGGRCRGWMLTRTIAKPPQRQMRKRSETEIKKLAQTNLPRSDEYTFADHHIHHYLHLGAALGASPEPCEPSLAVSDSEIEAFRQKWNLSSSFEGRTCGLNPGAEYGRAKRWPVERFIAAAQEITNRIPCRWIIFGSNQDEQLGAEITTALSRTNLEALNLVGKTSLRELMAGLKCCDALLSNDTGPMHVAAALGTRVIVPFGSTSPELTGPGLPGDNRHALIKGEAPCAPCFRRICPIDFRCMKSISPEKVIGEVLKSPLLPNPG
jgi:heptosyltransferase-2